jgi:hypothetical protein
LTRKSFGLRKRFYIVLVSRDEDGSLRKVPVPLHYAYGFVAVAVIGAFTIAGLAGSYSRMLIKTARFNQLRNDNNSLQKDYAHLEQQAHERDVQAASLSSLATEVSALYGLTASKLAGPMGHMGLRPQSKSAAAKVGESPLIPETASNFSESDDSYYKSLDTFYSLRDSAISGAATHAIDGGSGLGTFSGRNGCGSRCAVAVAGARADPQQLRPARGPDYGQRRGRVPYGDRHRGADRDADPGDRRRGGEVGCNGERLWPRGDSRPRA